MWRLKTLTRPSSPARPVTSPPRSFRLQHLANATKDLVSAALGGKVLGCSNEWFAEGVNLLTPTSPIHQPGKMVYTGAWYDGWETRRHNPEPFDWVVVRLGVASGKVVGVEIDTTFFSGNHAPAISVEGCFSTDDAEVIGWAG